MRRQKEPDPRSGRGSTSSTGRSCAHTCKKLARKSWPKSKVWRPSRAMRGTGGSRTSPVMP
eukprot:4462208-Heterocapsa_arctica.AAC.1